MASPVRDSAGTASAPSGGASTLSAKDLLAGSGVVHDIPVPPEILTPAAQPADGAAPRVVRMRPLSVAVLTLISRAARDDAGLVPLLMIKEALVEPALTLDQIRQLPVGLAHFLVSQANLVSGLDADGETIGQATDTALSQAHVLLAKHFGWTPRQVSRLTPGQVAVYLAGVEKLLQLAEMRE
jgi:hypothetical protein